LYDQAQNTFMRFVNHPYGLGWKRCSQTAINQKHLKEQACMFLSVFCTLIK